MSLTTIYCITRKIKNLNIGTVEISQVILS